MLKLIATWGTYAWKGWAPLADVAFAPDGQSVWTVDHAGWIAQWDPVTGEPVRRLPLDPGQPPQSVPRAAALTPDGTRMLVSRMAGTLAAYDLATGARLWETIGVGAGMQMVPAIDQIAISADGTFAATAAPGETNPTVRLWDVATGMPRGSLAGFARSLALLPDHAHVLIDGQRVVELATGAVAFAVPGPARATVGACSPDGTTIITGNEDGELACWEAARLRAPDARPVWQARNTSSSGENTPISRIRVTPDRVFTTSTLSHQTWLRTNGRRVRDVPFQGTWRVTYAPGGTRAFGIALHQWRLCHLDLIHACEVRPPWEHEQTVATIAASPDGTLMATGSTDATLRTWDLPSGRPRAVIAAGEVRAVAFTPDGRHVIHIDSWGSGAVHDALTGLRAAHWSAFELKLKPFTGVLATPDGAAILVDDGGTVLRWDLAAGREVWRRSNAWAKRATLAGDRLVVALTTCELQLWNVATGDTLATHAVPDRLKTQPQHLLDDRHILAIHTGTGLVVRELATGKILQRFPGTESADGLLVQSPNGRLAAIATATGLQLWDLARAALVGEADLAAQLDAIASVAFTPDGRGILAGTARGLVLRYAISE